MGVWLPPVDDASSLRVKICVEMLMDPRFNPYESSAKLIDGVDQRDWEDKMELSWQLRICAHYNKIQTG